ncbi:hypothetical protein [Falsiruegeria litorea]|nr:hypothetical protein [Falsiruegeria litorea]
METLPTRISASDAQKPFFVRTQNPEAPYLPARVSKRPNNGPHRGAPVQVALREPKRPDSSSAVLLAPSDIELINQVVGNFGPQLSEKTAFEAGKMIASQTVCFNQQITRNSVGRSYSDPKDIAKIAQSGTNILDAKVPSGARGELIPRAEYVIGGWKVNLWCK